jgi:hypothetical protein
MTMKKIQFFLAAIVAVVMSSCVNFKTEATVDVKVTKDDNPVPGIVVYKIKDNGLGVGLTLDKGNASGNATTNAGGVAHFELKSPDDMDPSEISVFEDSYQETFFFCTYDAEGTRNSLATVQVKIGDNKSVDLIIEANNGGDEE